MSINPRVTSEIGALRCVVVHRPGDEVARMTQHQLDKLLFDDILSPAAAVREHDLMTDILRGAGAEVLEIQQLLVDALTRASGRERQSLLTAVCEPAGAGPLVELLAELPPEALAKALVVGVRWEDLDAAPITLGRLRRQLTFGDEVALPSVPNLMFMRDPCTVIHDRIVVGRMATEARSREPLLVSFAAQHASSIAGARLLFAEADEHRHARYRRLEGGDVLVLSPEMLLIGCSERTSADTVERLVHESIFDAFPATQRVYAAFMPEQRSIMHLDTVITQIDTQLFLGHEPLVAGPRAVPVARLERDQPPTLVEGATLLDVLREELGGDVAMVPCGGADPIDQEREQWTDGANAVCLSPGHIILYARNVHTIAALTEHGFEELEVHAAQPPEQRAALIAEGMARPRTVFSFDGSELSRARGGGRCLTMPLRRD